MGEAEPSTLTNIALRVGFALLAAGVSWLLYANAPDKGGFDDVMLCIVAAGLAFTYICIAVFACSQLAKYQFPSQCCMCVDFAL